MTDHDNYLHHQLDPQFEDEQPSEAAAQDWQPEKRDVDPDIEDAFLRKRPGGHIAFAGGTALDNYNPKL